ncbi:MAG: hypothetical protein IKJ06_02260 [Clostridia bacterium]|nr:hypothetical protein [Clostridia bacterium]
MDLLLELSLLFDYYGALLTETQQAICDMYYNQNLSLTEIAEDLSITKQGVRDALKKSEKLLKKYENALKIKQKNDQISLLIQNIECKLDENISNDSVKNEFKEITKQINELI